MIRKYTADGVIISIVFLLVFFLADRPVVNYNPVSAVRVPIGNGTIPDKPEETKAIEGNKVSYAALGKRNIFAAMGAYTLDVKSSTVLPAIPYTLIAVLQGNDKKAVFREYTGAILTVPVGKKMIDEYVVESIEGLTVRLKRAQERKKLTVFNPESVPAAVFPEDRKKVPANPYKLIGILKGKERKAVIKDHTNAIAVRAVGEKLGDGSVVIGIGDVSVKLRKDKETIELNLFAYRVP